MVGKFAKAIWRGMCCKSVYGQSRRCSVGCKRLVFFNVARVKPFLFEKAFLPISIMTRSRQILLRMRGFVYGFR